MSRRLNAGPDQQRREIAPLTDAARARRAAALAAAVCGICKRPLNTGARGAIDCGGDCLDCCTDSTPDAQPSMADAPARRRPAANIPNPFRRFVD